MPISDKDAADPNFIRVFDTRRPSPETTAKAATMEAEWKKQLADVQMKAAALLKGLTTPAPM